MSCSKERKKNVRFRFRKRVVTLVVWRRATIFETSLRLTSITSEKKVKMAERKIYRNLSCQESTEGNGRHKNLVIP